MSMKKEVPRKSILNEVNELATSNTDVTWGERMVVVVLRSQKEIDNAKELGLRPIGTTLTLLRFNSKNEPVYSDEQIINFLAQIK